MGGGIAQVVAASGRRVSLHDAVPGAVDRGLVTMRKSLERLPGERGPGPGEGGAPAPRAPAPDEVLPRVQPVDALVRADLMVEAVVEDAQVKEDVFRRADAILPEEA